MPGRRAARHGDGEKNVQFRVAPEVFARFPGMRIAVVVATGLDNAADRPGVAATWQRAWAGAAREAAHGNAQSHPHVRSWRERFRAMGVSGKEFPSSIEALLRRALRGGEPPRINPLVDLYNAVSLRHVVPAGGFDLDQLRGPLELRLTREGDRFTALDATGPLAVPPGEVAYADGATILTRHFVWRQSREGLIGPATRSVALVAEVPGELDAALVGRVRDGLAAGLRDEFGAVPIAFIVDEGAPTATW